MPGGTSDTRSDEHLLSAHINGDLHAFSTLIRRHQERLWAVAYRTLNNPDDAADALQDALFNAHRMAHSYRADARVSTWLHRIVVNACLDRIRRDKLRPTVSLPDFEIPALAAREDRYAAVDLSMSIGDALAQLPEEQRAVVVALDVEGLSIAETAQRLGVAEGTVKSRSSRARLRLAKLLGHLKEDS
ncbi:MULTISPECIES: RNA polymerase sigma factor SigM [Gordonia]|uniref:RNA polymerase ECF-type sigma factor SigM n=1 Tax=Gordonia sputi NBRC 100414 TaxID=1089453 RepID=H5U0P4_9ACTN|nr:MULTISPECIES: RNA polymerase sigma factor SigM [Gordonia]MCM3896338.1 RNA polymerase sigma factor SigM [Gordonia sputi]NKY94299.1 RNA polymerase sigma factor SigM [Gordonia sputi]OBA30992.1 RNA polymerase sigma factor SigM [Gordonia sp. 852002-51296_SCH5728562-b]GAB39312.1 RNA polymerase ECF-type sigma factor SigM [Gordonia sputi NBRC 100414]